MTGKCFVLSHKDERMCRTCWKREEGSVADEELPSPFAINEERYLSGNWVADLEQCWIYAVKHRFSDEELEERRKAYLSSEGVRKTISMYRDPLKAAENDRGECVYLALFMPKLALKSEHGNGYHHTLSNYHHFSLYYGCSNVSLDDLLMIRSACEEAFYIWCFWKNAPLERPYAFITDFFREVYDDQLVIHEKILNLSDENIEQLQNQDCIEIKPRMVEAAGYNHSLAVRRELQRLRARDIQRRDHFVAIEEKITAEDANAAQILNIKLRHGMVRGEAHCLLTYLHDVLYYKCRVWYRGDIEQTALLGPLAWHMSMQFGGLAMTKPEFLE